MSKKSRHCVLLGKISYITSAALLIAALVTNLLPPKTVMADPQGKVYVCKYVGKPGVDERLQAGQNPIEVSINTIPEPVVIGSYFPDAQGRSYVLGFVPMVPEPTRADCPPPSGPEAASAAVTTGICSWTEADGSLTPVTLTLNHALLTINGVTYNSSQTINLPPGSYPYSWTAENGYIGSGSGTVVVGDCTPGSASASVITGACSWTQETGSLTPVTLTLNHAWLTINGVTYTSSQTINLPPGSYPYSWTAESGYIGNGDGTVVVGDCAPGYASVSVTSGTCGWTQELGSLTQVTFTLNHASLTINGVTYTSSQTINLPPGSYPYSWTAESGYIGNGSGTIVIGDCTPGIASAEVTTGTCSWTQVDGSLTPVTITLNHASLTINGVTYSSSQTFNLPPGSYPYSWTAESGYIGNGSGTVIIGDCTPGNASAAITTGTCSWTEADGSLTPVTLTLYHASLTINGVTYSSSQTINLAPGSYPYSWMADSGYVGNGSGTVVIGSCTPGTANASVTTGACSWSQAAGSLTPVTLTLSHASLTINGVTYTSSQTINLSPGSYPYSWTGESGFVGNGSGTVVIGDCAPGIAEASISFGACTWTEAAGSQTQVMFTLSHASLTINGVTYTSSQIIYLPPGSYPYSWTADSGYIGNGSGTVAIGDCTPGTASASMTTGACSWSQGTGSQTPVTLVLSHASLTINGVTYTFSQTINLPPGSYPYSWTADIGYLGSGSGKIDVGDCTPGTATADITIGTCSWSEASGSKTAVTLTLNHTSLTINGVTYTSSQTINLSPGSYPYSWTADSGYIGNGGGTVVVGDCTPGTASASITTGICNWTQESGSKTPVTINLSHATLSIDGATYSTSQTINLGPGSYPYSWAAESGFIGNGSGTIVIGDCTPGTANAEVTVGTCNWTQLDGSQTPVTLSLSHASLTINGVTYTSSQTINLQPGSYPYSWTAESGYIGNGSGIVVIADCTPGTAGASLTPGTCGWTDVDGSLTPVTIALSHASLTINGVTYTSSQTINLPPGSYPYSWTAESGYIGSGNGTVNIGDCSPGFASVSVTTGTCNWTQAFGSLTPVTLTLSHASLTINGVTYTSSQTIKLAPGSYPYTWTAMSGYSGNGSGTVVIGNCTPGDASGSVTIGACSWTQTAGSKTPVTIALNHASLTINGVTYTTSQTINLAPGSYPYSWAAESGFIGNGSGTVVIGECAPGNASVSVTTGTCSWTQASGSLTPVIIFLNHATLTISGATYTSSQIINLAPGSYPYTWTAQSGYTGNGSGMVEVGDCPPDNAGASLTIGSCNWTQTNGSITPVTLTLSHASLTINGWTFTSSQTINLAPGSYPYSWTVLSGYMGSVDGTIVIIDCPPVLPPVSGVDMGLLRRILPGSLFGLSLSFAGLGTVLFGIGRRRNTGSKGRRTGDTPVV